MSSIRGEQPVQPAQRRKSRWRAALKFLLIIAFIILLGDFGYSRYVANRISRWESESIRDADGVLVDCREYTLCNGSTAVLFVHGINESPYAWRKLAPFISNSGLHCRVMRLPGFAEPITNYASYDAEDWISSVASELAELRKGHQHVFLVAHSLGAAISLQTILRDPKLCDGMVLLAPMIKVSDVRSPVLPTRTWHNIAKILLFTRTVKSGFKIDAMDPKEKDSPNRTIFTPRSVINETFRLVDANAGQASRLNLPVLLVVSHNDHVIDSQAAMDFFCSRDAKLTEVMWHDEAAHALPYDFGWEKIAMNAIQFFHRQTEGKSESRSND